MAIIYYNLLIWSSISVKWILYFGINNIYLVIQVIKQIRWKKWLHGVFIKLLFKFSGGIFTGFKQIAQSKSEFSFAILKLISGILLTWNLLSTVILKLEWWQFWKHLNLKWTMFTCVCNRVMVMYALAVWKTIGKEMIKKRFPKST